MLELHPCGVFQHTHPPHDRLLPTVDLYLVVARVFQALNGDYAVEALALAERLQGQVVDVEAHRLQVVDPAALRLGLDVRDLGVVRSLRCVCLPLSFKVDVRPGCGGACALCQPATVESVSQCATWDAELEKHTKDDSGCLAALKSESDW